MHDLGIPGINECIPSIGEYFGANLERDRRGEVLAVPRQSGDEVTRYVVVDTPHVTFQLRLRWGQRDLVRKT